MTSPGSGQPTGIGETLRAARRQLGATLADAAGETRVRETYLAALEEEEFEALGGEVYAKGFLRSYARFLRLDPDPLLAAYQETYGISEEQPAFPQNTVGPMEEARPPGLGILAVLAVLLVVIVAAAGLRGGVDRLGAGRAGPTTGATTPLVAVPAPGPQSPTAAPATPVAPNVTPTQVLTSLDVSFAVTGNEAWMRVTVDGVVEREGPQPAGTSMAYQPQREIELRVGDAAQVQITVNGEDLGALGQPGEVVLVRCAIGQAACSREVVA